MKRFYLVPLALLAACAGGPNTSTKGQMIECSTDPGTGVVLQCAPVGDGSGVGGSNTCRDVDEDGDGQPHDSNPSKCAGSGSGSGSGPVIGLLPDDGGHDGSDDGAKDSDCDGIPDDEDCDNHQGEDDCGDNGADGIDLPYDVKPQLGATATPIADAFAESGGAEPAAILSVTMDSGTWRLAELQAGTPFVVTQDDCDHPGNRDIGRDRVVVTWQDTAGAQTRADHLDIRYCDN
jgi:hypothetical protein